MTEKSHTETKFHLAKTVMSFNYIGKIYFCFFHTTQTNNGVVTHLEPDILECEVKWALGSITTNKASGGDRIPAELLQILKDDTVKSAQYISKFGKLSSDHRTEGQFSFQSQRKVMPKNVQTPAQLYSFHS